MANRYWVGGTGTWDASSTANWSTTSGGASGASVPGTADVAIFDQAATYTVTFSGTGSRTALAITNTAGTVTFAGTTAVALGGLTLEAVAVWSHTGTLDFTVAGTHTLDTKNVMVRSPTFAASGTSWTLVSDFSTQRVYVTELSQGTLNLNGYTLTVDYIRSNTTLSRTLAFGTGQIIVTGGALYPVEFGDVSSGLTMTGSKQIVFVDRLYSAQPIIGNHEINLNVTAGSYPITFAGSGVSPRIGTLNCTGYSGGLDGNLRITGSLTLGAGTTWTQPTNIMTFEGAGTKLVTTSGTVLPTISINASGGTVQLQDALTAAGTLDLIAGTLDLNGFTLTATKMNRNSVGTLVLAFGSTGQITLVGEDPNLLLLYTSFSMTGSKRINISSTRTASVSMVVGTYGVNLYVTQGSFTLQFLGTSTVGALDGTGYSGQIQSSLSITGNLTLAAGTTWNGGTITFSGAGTKLVTTNGVVLPLVTVNASGGTVQLQDSLTATGTARFSAGTLDLNGFTLTSDQFEAFINISARTLAFGSTGQITVTGLVTTTIIDFYNSSYPSLITMTGSKRINISSARATPVLADLGPYEVDLYVTQGAYALGISGNSVIRNANFTGFTGVVGGSINLTGNLVLGAGMTGVGSSLTLTTTGTGLQTITSNGVAAVDYLRIIGTGTVQLQDALTLESGANVEIVSGVLDLNGFVMEVNIAYLVGYDDLGDPTTPELRMSSGTIRVEYGLAFDVPEPPAALPTVTGSGTIEIFGDVVLSDAVVGWGIIDIADTRVAAFPTVRHTGTTSLKVYGNNTFTSFESASTAGALGFFQGETSTFGTFDVSGAPGNLKTVTAGPGYDVVATQATLLKSTPWFVGANSVDSGNNTGLIFTAGGINDYLTISNINGGGAGNTYATAVAEGVDLSDAAVAAEIKPTSVQEAVEAQDTTAVVVSDLVWSEFDDSQTPNWQNVDNTQVPTWTPVDDSQTPGWTPVTP